MSTHPQESQQRVEYAPPTAVSMPSPPSMSPSHQAAAAKSLAQTFGLDIRAAILTVLVDLMVFGSDVLSGGLLIPFGMAVAATLGFIVYKIQGRWYGDDHDSALIKALIVGLLTAIPVPLTPIVAIPSGALGIINMLRKK